MSAQPDKRLNGNDSANPDKGPFGSTNVLLVEFRGKEISQKDGPGNDKGPYVGMEMKRQRAQKFSRLDLRIINERRHVGGNLAGASQQLKERAKVSSDR